ncbi:FAD-dependent oxidoreductase domain-containing protein 1 [Gryllus bimaculatus]|nr:FAD-dependent oxidoreductase domain-containing protein 1 [Gryllus bimaculatus]
MSRLGSHSFVRLLKCNVRSVRICGGQRFKSNEPSEFENPVSRTIRVLKGDVKNYFSLPEGEKTFRKQHFLSGHCDVLVIGGGIMGSSIAYWLKQRARQGLHVVVVEKDPTVIPNNVPCYTSASTVLSVGGIRQQFSVPESIQMSLFGAEFLRNVKKHLYVEGHDPPDVQFTPTGYLFLATEKGATQLEENYKLQQELGAKNELLLPTKLKEKFPWLNTEDIALGCHGLRDEGWFDPWSLLDGFKKKAINLGAEYIQGEAVGFKFKSMPDVMVEGVEPGTYEALDTLLIKTPSGDIHPIKFGLCVIAAGPQSGAVAKMARIGNGAGYLQFPLPVEPRKRYVYAFNCPNGPGLNTPLTIDPTGAYFRREGLAGNFIGGRSPDVDKEPSTENLDVDHQFFDDHVWPHIAKRVKAFEGLKVNSAWAGFYEYNTFDANGIVGLHPYYQNLYLATGFSGHGIQHGPAVGRAVMEMIVDGGFKTIDLSRLSFDRIITGNPILENNIW